MPLIRVVVATARWLAALLPSLSHRALNDKPDPFDLGLDVLELLLKST
jgi:hypothetical protein